MKRRRGIAARGIAVAAALGAQAGELTGDLSVEVRGFPQSPAHPGQDDERLGLSLALAPEWYQTFGPDDRASFLLTPFGRWDRIDERRSHLDLREAIFTFYGDTWEARAGVGKVFWGVTETRHLVDIVNQTDLVEDPDTEAKLGQPMVHVTWLPEWDDGRFEFFALPGVRLRTLPGEAGRLRPGPPIRHRPTYESSAGDDRLDAAMRYGVVLGDVDIALSGFRGTSREPEFRPVMRADGMSVALRPHYPVISQVGMEIQWTREATLWKLEAISRAGLGDPFQAATAGLEHTLYGVADTGADLGLLVEFHYDGRDAELAELFDRDLFGGFRVAANDTQSTEVLAGVSVDLRHGSLFYNVEASRRIGDRHSLGLRARLFSADGDDAPARAVRRDDYIELELTRFF